MTTLSPSQTNLVFAVLVGLLIGTLLIDAGLFVAWAVTKDDVDAGRRPPLFARRWSLMHVWFAGQAVIGILIGAIAAAGTLFAVAGIASGTVAGLNTYSGPVLWMILGSLFVQNALLVAVPVGIIKVVYRAQLADIGFTRLPSRRDWKLGIAGGVAVMALGFGLQYGQAWLVAHVAPPELARTLKSLTEAFSAEQMLPAVRRSLPLFLVFLAGGGIAAPIGEEFFFRGFLYQSGKRRLGIAGGMMLSAVVFALVHGGPLVILAIVPMGLLLAYMYERSQSLWVPIIMHAFNNSLTLVIAYLYPGI